MPDTVTGIGLENTTVRLSDIHMDQQIVKALRNLYG
jgi:hypothetical protein